MSQPFTPFTRTQRIGITSLHLLVIFALMTATIKMPHHLHAVEQVVSTIVLVGLLVTLTWMSISPGHLKYFSAVGFTYLFVLLLYYGVQKRA